MAVEKYWPEGKRYLSDENEWYFESEARLLRAKEQGVILEAKALLCDAAHNLIVDCGCMRGIIPREEGAVGISEGTVRDIAVISRVNKPVCFVVSDFSRDSYGQPVAVLSRRSVQVRCKNEYLSFLRPGEIIPVRVTHLEPFGAFVDAGCGLPSLIPIDAISISRIAHPRDRFCCGQEALAVVKTVERDRLTLSHKELLGTWEQNAGLFSVGETVSGIIRSVEEYGIFVELTPNLAGLAEPRENARAGQQASVYIKSLIPQKMKVKLIIIDTFDAEYTPPALEYFPVGNSMQTWRYSPEDCDKIVETFF